MAIGGIMGFSGISFGSLVMIAFVGLIFFGPERLKTMSKDLGEALAAFKQGLDKQINHDNKNEQKSQ